MAQKSLYYHWHIFLVQSHFNFTNSLRKSWGKYCYSKIKKEFRTLGSNLAKNLQGMFTYMKFRCILKGII